MSWLFSLSLFLFFQDPSTKTAPQNALERVVFVGASMSDGFGNGLPPSRLFEKAIVGSHQPVEVAGSSTFFMQPLNEGKRQVDRALYLKASMVVGLDYLFWYCYGFIYHIRNDLGDKQAKQSAAEQKDSEEADRLRLLEIGLKQLERIDVPLVIGDIPDMHDADPDMLDPWMIPSAEIIEKVNLRIRAWAASRKSVLLLPVAQWVKEMKEGRMEISLSRKGRMETVRLSAKEALQSDRLHPAPSGVVVVVDRLVQALHVWQEKDFAKSLRFDASAAFEEFADELESPSKKEKKE